MNIAGCTIGEFCFIVAELSSNHGGRLDVVADMMAEANDCGADAVKLQTYLPEQMPDKDELVKGCGLDWDGRKWLDVYRELALPWSWFPKLVDLADKMGIILFTTVCSLTALEWLENHCDMPCYKIPSWLSEDIDLITQAARHKPLIITTDWIFRMPDVVILTKDVRRIEGMAKHVPVGLSNHGPVMDCVEAVKAGACVVEQHFTLDRSTIDGGFAALPSEFEEMVREIRACESPT